MKKGKKIKINSTVEENGLIEKDYYISPSYILQMEKVARWCDELANPSKDNWEELNWNLPINLRLM